MPRIIDVVNFWMKPATRSSTASRRMVPAIFASARR